MNEAKVKHLLTGMKQAHDAVEQLEKTPETVNMLAFTKSMIFLCEALLEMPESQHVEIAQDS